MLIIIALLIFQIIPLSVSGTDGYSEAAHNSGAFLHSGDFHQDPVIAGRDNRKHELSLNISKLSGPVQLQAFDPYVSIRGFCRKFTVFDVRQEVKKSIPSYFHESKYRKDHFLI